MTHSTLAPPRRLVCATAAALVAGLTITSFLSVDDADAARRRRRRGRALAVQLVNLDGRSGVPGNAVVEVVFNTKVREGTINHAQFQVREQNANQTGFTKQVFGIFQYLGSSVRFYPRLPTHLRDPGSATNAFYPVGTAQDNAAENAGLRPSKNYEIRLLGRGSIAPIRSARGRVLRRSVTANFTTAAATDPAEHYTTTTYVDSPPPRFSFSNPPDRVPTAQGDQYASRGGAPGVSADTGVSVFCTKVPIAPTTARIQGNISLTLLERDGNPGVRRPVSTEIFVEQNFNTTLLVVKPKFPLADRAVYGLRITKNVLDLTEQFDFQPNRGRETLRAIYNWLVQARAGNPGLPADQLEDPPVNLIGDWPAASDTVGRGILKRNMLDLGDNSPDEIDPRIHAMFSTRDEPITDAQLVINFLRSENLNDAILSTGEWDDGVPGAASAIMTAAAGTGELGDYRPTSDDTLNVDTFTGGVLNFRDVVIPQGVVVTLVGSIPANIRAMNFTLAGTLDASGADGRDSGTTTQTGTSATVRRGGAGGPGGGDGGDSDNTYQFTGTANIGGAGEVGNDLDGNLASPDDGGRGGGGGISGTDPASSANNLGAGGGGGGGRLPGTNGGSMARPGSTLWTTTGGAGGAGAIDNLDLDPLVGGAGGGAGCNGTWHTGSSRRGTPGASAGGGGGAVHVQTGRTLNITTTGLIRSNGGVGGKNTGASSSSTPFTGSGGGGAGGSVKLASASGFSIADPSGGIEVLGGAGGAQGSGTTTWGSPLGGNGGDGFIRINDPDGGLVIPNGTAGFFDPVGGGVPSYVWSKFVDLGVDDPRLLNFGSDDILTDPTSNDAILVEMQMTREHPSIFGQADLTALDALGNSINTNITSQWIPAKVHDASGSTLPAIPVTGAPYDKGADGAEYIFPIDQLNGNGYRYVRLRITFQLDDFQTTSDPLPNVDHYILHYQTNF